MVSGLSDSWDVSERYFEAAADELEVAPHQLSVAARTDDAQSVLGELAGFLRRYVVLSEAQTVVIALWVVHTHCLQAASATAYLSITSAEAESGKTRLLEALEQVVAKPWLTGRTSAAALPRKIDADCPTLLLDESDAAFNGERDYAEALRGILNSGYRRSGRASLCVGQGANLAVRDFSTFCAKAVAGIGSLPDTVASRSLPIRLTRRAPDERVEPFYEEEVREGTEPLRQALAAFAEHHLDALASARPALPAGLRDRTADCVRPLLAIADLAGGGWPHRSREAILELTTHDGDDARSLGVRLLADIKRVFDEHSTDRFASGTLADALVAIEEAPWGDLRGKPLDARGLARMLKRYGTRPRTIRLDDDSTPKGYLREQFEDLWRRYLPHVAASESPQTAGAAATPPQPAPLSEKPAQPSRHTTPVVADREQDANPHQQTDVADVADTTPLPGDEGFRDSLNSAYAAGQITHRERHERRISHDHIRRGMGQSA